MKKIIALFAIVPVFFLSGCSLFGDDALDYHKSLVEIENDLSATASSLETILTPIVTEAMTDGFDNEKYNTVIAPTLAKLDDNLARTNALGGFEGDESVTNALIASTQAIKDVFETDVPELLTALTENPEAADGLMQTFIDKMTAMQKYDNDLSAALKAFDENNGLK